MTPQALGGLTNDGVVVCPPAAEDPALTELAPPVAPLPVAVALAAAAAALPAVAEVEGTRTLPPIAARTALMVYN